MFHIYILRCADNSLYVGFTEDLEERLATHNDGRGALFTRLRRPVTLVHSEPFDTADEAIARERQLKGWSRIKKEALVAGDLATLREAARRRKR